MNSKVASELESVSAALSSIGAQASSIARGLENVAPASSSAATGPVHYLHAMASRLELDCQAVSQGVPVSGDENHAFRKLADLAKEILQHDASLREKFTVGDRFRFVRDRLQELQVHLENLASQETVVADAQTGSVGQESWVGQSVFVYLYNAQGAILKTWVAMLTPKALYEYSVNRPVYAEQKEVEDVIALKPNRAQHAYLTILVKPEDILLEAGRAVRIREGGLRIEKVMVFTHNGQEYIFERGELMKKS